MCIDFYLFATRVDSELRVPTGARTGQATRIHLVRRLIWSSLCIVVGAQPSLASTHRYSRRGGASFHDGRSLSTIAGRKVARRLIAQQSYTVFDIDLACNMLQSYRDGHVEVAAGETRPGSSQAHVVSSPVACGVAGAIVAVAVLAVRGGARSEVVRSRRWMDNDSFKREWPEQWRRARVVTVWDVVSLYVSYGLRGVCLGLFIWKVAEIVMR